MMNQKEGVFVSVVELFGEVGVGGVELSREQRSELVDCVTTGILEGGIEFSAEAKAKYDTPEKVRSYCVGLVNNWLRKDTRLNGGTKYEAKNPGSRQGCTDEVIKNLKALRSNLTEAVHIEAVDAKIAERLAEIAAAKPAPKKMVDVSKLPADIRALLGL